MATDIRALPAFFNTDTDFRNWIIGLQAQFTAMGLVQTSDTGQVNTGTVAKPAGTNTAQGYDVWRFADTLQATLPVFMKIEYGSSGAVDRPSLWFTVGTSTNGAGTVTGQSGTRKQNSPTTSKTAGVTLNSYCSGSTGRLSLMTNLDPSSSAFAIGIMIERPKTSAGVEQSGAIVTCQWSPALGSWSTQLVPSAGSVPAAQSIPPWPSLSHGGLSTVGTAVALLPGLVVYGACYFVAALAYIHADIGELASFTATHFGATHTFLPMGDGGATGSQNNQASSAGHAIAMLWE